MILLLQFVALACAVSSHVNSNVASPKSPFDRAVVGPCGSTVRNVTNIAQEMPYCSSQGLYFANGTRVCAFADLPTADTIVSLSASTIISNVTQGCEQMSASGPLGLRDVFTALRFILGAAQWRILLSARRP